MAMTMKEKASNSHVNTEWAPALKVEFAREAASPNGCVGSELLSETSKLRVWTIRLKPGERFSHLRVRDPEVGGDHVDGGARVAQYGAVEVLLLRGEAQHGERGRGPLDDQHTGRIVTLSPNGHVSWAKP